MSETVVERGAIHVSSVSSTSSESIDSDPERQPLLTDISPGDSTYKSIGVGASEEYEDEENGSSEEPPTSKSVLAIISLLLVGKGSSQSRERTPLIGFRGLYIQRRWHPCACNIRHRLF